MYFKEIKEKIALLGNKAESEENLKVHITKWMLVQLGYDEDTFDYEHTLCRDKVANHKTRHADIFIPVENAGGMFVETKKYNKNLTEQDVIQLAEYISMKKDIEWGILTNGRQIFLLNNSIDISGKNDKNFMNKVVMNVEYNVRNGHVINEKYIKYFSKGNIYDTHTTYYFKAVAQFIAKHTFKKTTGIPHYQNTLWQFFDYYVSQGHTYILFGSNPYKALEDIADKDYIEFLQNYNSRTKKTSGKVPLAKCSHIKTMYDELEKNGYISNNTMKGVRERAKIEFETFVDEQVSLPDNILSEKNVQIILSDFENSPRKIIVFCLAAYYGWTRDKIYSFMTNQWECIDFKKHSFIVDQNVYPMIKIIEDNLVKIRESYKKRGIKSPKAIYVTKYNGKCKIVEMDVISDIFNDVKKCDKIEKDRRYFNPQNTRASAIKNMLIAGCSIEEIVYITDSPLSQLVKYLPADIIIKNGARKWKTKAGGKYKHPIKKMVDI